MYFDIQKLKNYMPLSFFAELNRDNYYNEIEPEILREMNITDLETAPLDWQYKPAAYIAVYIVADRFPNLTKEMLDRIRFNYDLAFNIISKNLAGTPMTIEANFNSVGVIDTYEAL